MYLYIQLYGLGSRARSLIVYRYSCIILQRDIQLYGNRRYLRPFLVNRLCGQSRSRRRTKSVASLLAEAQGCPAVPSQAVHRLSRPCTGCAGGSALSGRSKSSRPSGGGLGAAIDCVAAASAGAVPSAGRKESEPGRLVSRGGFAATLVGVPPFLPPAIPLTPSEYVSSVSSSSDSSASATDDSTPAESSGCRALRISMAALAMRFGREAVPARTAAAGAEALRHRLLMRAEVVNTSSPQSAASAAPNGASRPRTICS